MITTSDFSKNPKLFAKSLYNQLSYSDVFSLMITILSVVLFLKGLNHFLNMNVFGDTVVLHYISYLISENNSVPYKDIFSINLPGTLMIHMILGKIFGFSLISIKIMHSVWLILILFVNFFTMKSFGKLTAISSSAFIGFLFLYTKEALIFQREFIAILPVTLSLYFAFREIRLRNNRFRKYYPIMHGFLYGFCLLIKPHLIIGLPIIIYFTKAPYINSAITYKNKFLRFFKVALMSIIGICLIMIPVMGWLFFKGGLPYFIERITIYIPLLYLNLSGNHTYLANEDMLYYSIKEFLKFDSKPYLMIGSLLGYILIFINFKSKSLKRAVALLFTLTIVSILYPLISQKFFGHHWFIAIYFASVGCTLLIAKYLNKYFIFKFIFPILTILIFIFTAKNIIYEIENKDYISESQKILASQKFIDNYFENNLDPGQKIQTFITGTGMVNSMLEYKVLLATPFLDSHHISHHVSHPYIKKLRKEFLHKLEKSKPEFLLSQLDHPKLIGEDVSYSFEALELFIRNNYEVDYLDERFLIYRLKSD